MNLGLRGCLECGKIILLKINRDLIRKKFCSRNCRSTYYGKRNVEKIKLMHSLCNSEEANRKKGSKKENHPFWKENRQLVKRPRSSHEGKKWRKEVFERDNFTCQFCKIRGGKLQADHIKPYKLFPELRLELSNGRTLCEACHKTTNTYQNKVKKLKREDFENAIT